MAVRLLLDEQISPRVARLLHRAGVEAHAIAGTPWAGLDDESLLRLAQRDGFVFVTYDVGDFAPLLWHMAQEGGAGPGVIFVDDRRFPTSKFRRLAVALAACCARIRDGSVNPVGGVFLVSRA